MAFSMMCPNKGCGKLQAPFIDKETQKVYCAFCKKEIANVSPFMKQQMMMNKQFRKKEQKSFAVKCDQCKVEERPKLVNDEVVCGACDKPLTNLSSYFTAMLKQQLKKVDQDI